MPRSVTKYKENGVRTSMEHQNLQIRLRHISAREDGVGYLSSLVGWRRYVAVVGDVVGI
jgi:hypothetical protein